MKMKSWSSLVIVCSGGCGKTTEDVTPTEFWKGKVIQSTDPENLVPEWTCKECANKTTEQPQELRERVAELIYNANSWAESGRTADTIIKMVKADVLAHAQKEGWMKLLEGTSESTVKLTASDFGLEEKCKE